MKTRPILLTAVTFLISASFALAATKLSINTAGELNIADTNGKEVKTLTQGSVGDIVRADNQSFKISYGKDLQGNATIILYADPANPASVKINFQDKNINLSKDAVLTIVIDSAGSILQSGVLGQVMVENEKMAPSSNMRISNSGTLMASATPIVPVQEQPSVQIPVTSTPANRLSAPSVASGPAVVSYVTGKVYISQNGGPEVPMTDMSEIKPGTIIRTGDDGNVSFHPFPDVSTTVIKNSIFTIRELAYNPTGEAGKPDRRLLGFLSTGKLINVLDTKDNGITNYQIQTPIQIFTAVGTRFVVSVDPDVNQSLVQVYEGIVSASDGSEIYAMVQGLYSATTVPQFRPMGEDELIRPEDTPRGRNHYGQRYTNPALEDTINQVQAPFTPWLNNPITPTNP